MYQCTGIACGLDWNIGYDKCPICRGDLVPLSMIKTSNERGVATMNAAKAKELTNKALESESQAWWDTVKEKVFYYITEAASNGKNQLDITLNHKLNQDKFLDEPSRKNKLINELHKLNYGVTWSNGSYYEDGNDRRIIIKW